MEDGVQNQALVNTVMNFWLL